MLVNIRSIRGDKGASFRAQFRETSPGFDFPSGIGILEPVFVDVTVTNTGKGFLVRGEARTRLAMNCSRCLTPFEEELTASFLEEFKSGSDAVHDDGAEEELADVDDEINMFSGDNIDLTEVVRDALTLNLPMKILCREDCRGICPHCGQDLNEGDCDCEDEDYDRRFAALAELFKGDGDDDD